MKSNLQLTELEKKMIETILHDYESVGANNTEFRNMTWHDDEIAKRWRGTFTSLKRKKIVDHYNDKDCFNPIFPTTKLLEACKVNGIEISKEALQEIRNYINVED